MDKGIILLVAKCVIGPLGLASSRRRRCDRKRWCSRSMSDREIKSMGIAASRKVDSHDENGPVICQILHACNEAFPSAGTTSPGDRATATARLAEVSCEALLK